MVHGVVYSGLGMAVSTTTQVTLTYEDIAVDRTAQNLTMLGAIGLVLLGWRRVRD